MNIVFALVRVEEELSVEELDPDDGKDELEEEIDDEDVENVLKRDDHAIKYSLQLWHSIDCLHSY